MKLFKKYFRAYRTIDEYIWQHRITECDVAIPPEKYATGLKLFGAKGGVYNVRDCGWINFVPKELPNVSILPVHTDKHELAIEMIKQYYLTEHVLVRDRRMNLIGDRALDEYLVNLLKQGNTLYAKTGEGTVAGLCVSFASSPIDAKNLRSYAFYRQDPNTKDFLYFMAKLQETPNLWNFFNEPKIFEIKMLTVLPEFRRQGLATMLVEKSTSQAQSQGYKIVRMDCINPFDYKVAERCMLNCLTKFPLHKLRGTNAPFIKRSSDFNRCVRVYVNVNCKIDTSEKEIKEKLGDLDDMLG